MSISTEHESEQGPGADRLQLQLPRVNLRPVPLAQPEGACDLDVLGLPVDEGAELIGRMFHQLFHPDRNPLGVDHIPADVVQRDGVGGEVERVVLPNELRARSRPTMIDTLDAVEDMEAVFFRITGMATTAGMKALQALRLGLPAYAAFSVQNQQNYTWALNPNDVRALQTSTGRIASTWFSSTSFTFDVNLTDGNTHQVALYALDWDNFQGGRSEKTRCWTPPRTRFWIHAILPAFKPAYTSFGIYRDM